MLLDSVLEPELIKENRFTLNIYNLFMDQVKVDFSGQVYALELQGIIDFLKLKGLDVEEIEIEIIKLKLIFSEFYLKNRKK